MDNSLTTRHLPFASSTAPRPAKIRFRKTNFDGTNPPIVVRPDQTTTGGMNLPLPELLFPSPEGEASGVRGEVDSNPRYYANATPNPSSVRNLNASYIGNR
jgi:hypothetical protein